MNNARIRKIAAGALLVALALALSVAEKLLPIGAIIPVPGVKLGLANVVTMLALFYIGAPGALVILVTRCLLGALFSGITALLFSLTGGLLALVVMMAHQSWIWAGVFDIRYQHRRCGRAQRGADTRGIGAAR